MVKALFNNMLACCLGIGAALCCGVLSGCNTVAELPPPGADQGAELQLWRDNATPVRVVCQIQQQGSSDFAMSLQGIVAEVPLVT